MMFGQITDVELIRCRRLALQ